MCFESKQVQALHNGMTKVGASGMRDLRGMTKMLAISGNRRGAKLLGRENSTCGNPPRNRA